MCIYIYTNIVSDQIPAALRDFVISLVLLLRRSLLLLAPLLLLIVLLRLLLFFVLLSLVILLVALLLLVLLLLLRRLLLLPPLPLLHRVTEEISQRKQNYPCMAYIAKNAETLPPCTPTCNVEVAPIPKCELIL